MPVDEPDRSNPPPVDPHLAFLRRAIGGERVGLFGDAVGSAVPSHVGLGLFTECSIVAGEFCETGRDLRRECFAGRPVARHHLCEPSAATLGGMERPVKFEHTRFLGDKRTQLVYDLDTWEDRSVIDDIVDAEVGLCFGPDTLAEARNRGYTLATPGKTRRHRAPRA